MTDDLKERLRTITTSGCNPYSMCHEAAHRISDLEARLAAAEAGEDALAEALRHMVGQFQHPDQMADEALAAYEARRKG